MYYANWYSCLSPKHGVEWYVNSRILDAGIVSHTHLPDVALLVKRMIFSTVASISSRVC